MNLHYLQHESYEIPANILKWGINKKYQITKTLLYKNEPLPDINDVDLLVIMGGPMNVYEDDKYQWLKPEKEFIEKAIISGKKILGLCLGAQLVACVLGATVKPNECREIGWFPIKLQKSAIKLKLFKEIPTEFTTFHWHSDTFEIPSNSIKIAESEACKNQGFVYSDRIIGLQFHPEVDAATVKNYLKSEKNWVTEKYVQDMQEISKNKEHYNLNLTIINTLLSELEKI
jgi:GMP synthase-like glutamine amidotransferase